jgi:hypothetical protein
MYEKIIHPKHKYDKITHAGQLKTQVPQVTSDEKVTDKCLQLGLAKIFTHKT